MGNIYADDLLFIKQTQKMQQSTTINNQQQSTTINKLRNENIKADKSDIDKIVKDQIDNGVILIKNTNINYSHE